MNRKDIFLLNDISTSYYKNNITKVKLDEEFIKRYL